MKQETKKWLEQAERDFDTAKYNLKGNKIEAGIFFLQQSTEKALKACLIEETNKFPKIHDLIRLGNFVNISDNLLKGCEKLTLAYIETRYPDTGDKGYTKKEIIEYIKIAEEILKWVTEKIS